MNPAYIIEPEPPRLPPFWIFLAGVLIITLLLCLVFWNSARAEDVNLDIISIIESNNNPNAYNPKNHDTGLFQITPICLREYNNYHYKNYLTCYEDGFLFQPIAYTKKDLFNPKINKQIANWYLNIRIPQLLKAYHLHDTINNRIWAYNAGIGNVVKNIMPKGTVNYIKKYHKLEKEI